VKKVFDLLLKEIRKCFNKDEVPVACVLVKDGRVIAYDHNKKEEKKDPLAHAEILCIRKASKKLKTWNLGDCELYVTLEPCEMCKAVIDEARIKKVYYFNKSHKKEIIKLNILKLLQALLIKYLRLKLKIFLKINGSKNRLRLL